MITVNPHYAKLQASYLFSDIARRVRAFQEETLRLSREREAAAEEFRLDLARASKEQEAALASLRKATDGAAAALALPSTPAG